MKLLICFLFSILLSASCLAQGFKHPPGFRTFQGAKFEIVLNSACSENDLNCDSVSYDGVNKKTGARLHLKGRLISDQSRERQWYDFKNGQYLYMLTPDYTPSNKPLEIWNLNVFHKGEYIASDEGAMY